MTIRYLIGLLVFCLAVHFFTQIFAVLVFVFAVVITAIALFTQYRLEKDRYRLPSDDNRRQAIHQRASEGSRYENQTMGGVAMTPEERFERIDRLMERMPSEQQYYERIAKILIEIVKRNPIGKHYCDALSRQSGYLKGSTDVFEISEAEANELVGGLPLGGYQKDARLGRMIFRVGKRNYRGRRIWAIWEE